jgi:hypothetical protein
LAILGVLVAAAAYFSFSNRNSGDPGGGARTAVSTAAPVGVASQKAALRPVSRSTVRVTQSGVGKNPKEFRPSMKLSNVPPESVDPTLHLNLLMRLQDVKVEATSRSLFEISTAPPVALITKEPDKIKVAARGPVGPMPPLPTPTPPTPKAPPIPLKFYGFVNPARPDVKRAFFLDNEDIIVAGEGDLIKKRYKIVRIGINSAEVEDTQFKCENTKQTLPLETELPG